MTLAVLKERIEPHVSVKVFGLTFAGLTGASLLAATAIALISSPPAIDASVTIPLSGSSTVEDMAGQMTAGKLSSADMGSEPAPAVPGEIAPPPKAERPAIEDAIAGLHENTPFGLVPMIRASDKLTPYTAYQAKFEAAPTTKALISLVMVDYGLSKAASDRAISTLPEGVTLALSPYSSDAQGMTTTARQDGHEVWLSLPIQSASYGPNDSGNQTLLVNASVDQNKNRLLTNLAKATGYAGVIAPDTPSFSNSAADLEGIYQNISNRGLGLVQGNPKDTVTSDFATTNKTPFVQNDVWVDNVLERAAIDKQMQKLQELALNSGSAVGFFHPYPAVISAINDWEAKLATEQIQLAPLSATIKQKSP